jgi:hypothetical protein
VKTRLTGKVDRGFAETFVRSYLEQIRHHLSNCKALGQTITQIEKNLQEIETQYYLVSKKTGELHHTCEGLVLEEVRHIFFSLLRFQETYEPRCRQLASLSRVF